MRAIIKPSAACGTMQAPPSKSMAHRLLICAGLSRGESLIRGIAPSQDVLATIDCLRAMGARVEVNGDEAQVRGIDPTTVSPCTLPCRESGSTLRFFLPLCLINGQEMTLTGAARLLERPMTVYEDLCAAQGMRFERIEGGIRVQGRLLPQEYAIPGDVSSQFITGLLFALPLLEADSTIRLIPPVESRSYLLLTVQALRRFGIRVRWMDEYTLFVPGRQHGRAGEETVEGDCSNAAFLEALNLAGGSVQVSGLKRRTQQGDRVYASMMARLKNGRAVINLSDCPDLGPVLFAAAAANHGALFTGTRRLRFKESDRGVAMAEELAKLGVETEIEENRIRVRPAQLHAPTEPICGHNDHRVVMSMAVLCTLTGGVIEGAQAVNKSWPEFWDVLKQLGVEVTLDELG